MIPSDPNKNNQPDKLSDLDWTAFCYVSDELSDADRGLFEQKLEVDQQARESVANAYGQILILKAALEPGDSLARPAANAIETRQSKFRFNFRYVAAIAATLLVGIFLWTNRGQKPETVAFNGSESPELVENLISSEISESEEFASVVARTIESDEVDWSETNDDRDDSPVTLDGDWMVEAMAELGDEWEGLESDSDSEAS